MHGATGATLKGEKFGPVDAKDNLFGDQVDREVEFTSARRCRIEVKLTATRIVFAGRRENSAGASS